MLVAVIMMFMVLSFTGVAVLDISYNSRSASLETVDNVKIQYIIESEVNEAFWKINLGADSLVNKTADGLVTFWNDTTNTLTVSVDTLGMSTEISILVDADSHFERGLASNNEIQTNGHAYGLDKEHKSRKFDFLPNVNLPYFFDNAAHIAHGNPSSWKAADLEKEGIHIFTGNNLHIENMNLSNSTLVFTGTNITLSNNYISAPIPGENEDAVPAILIVNSNNPVTISSDNNIYGTIYSVGQLNVENATLSGPIIADLISLEEDIDLVDANYDEYYRWTAGFGDVDNYDWPKEVGTWKTTKWEKKRNG